MVVAATVLVKEATPFRVPLLPMVVVPLAARSKPSIVVTLPVAVAAPVVLVAVEPSTLVAEPTMPPLELPPTVRSVTATPWMVVLVPLEVAAPSVVVAAAVVV